MHAQPQLHRHRLCLISLPKPSSPFHPFRGLPCLPVVYQKPRGTQHSSISTLPATAPSRKHISHQKDKLTSQVSQLQLPKQSQTCHVIGLVAKLNCRASALQLHKLRQQTLCRLTQHSIRSNKPISSARDWPNISQPEQVPNIPALARLICTRLGFEDQNRMETSHSKGQRIRKTERKTH